MDLIRLIDNLRSLVTETSWVEFKHNNFNPVMIGEDVSALANAAAIAERGSAYMLWGIHNETHDILGTAENLQTIKIGNEELENWLRHQLSDNADFTYQNVEYSEGRIVGVLTIPAAVVRPVAFKKEAYVRVGSYTKRLRDYPEVEAKLWDRLRNRNFEKQLALVDLTLQDALQKLDLGIYFDKTKTPLPSTIEAIGELMCKEKVLFHQDNGLFAISNLGAVLFAKSMSDFPRVSRKAVRVIQYHGVNRMRMVRENTGTKGYAVGLEGIIGYIQALTPADEPIEGVFRDPQPAYPEIAIRELVANALIHQDLSVTGAGPLVEIFDNRIEISNPGECVIAIDRIVDSPPWSRNEDVAALMRRMKMCEEAGGGWDKAVLACEEKYHPAPKLTKCEGGTRVFLFACADFASMTGEDRVWACYMHACIQYVQFDYLTNTSLRKRFGLTENLSGNASRVIHDAVMQKLIKAIDPNTAPRYMKYVPYWA